MGIVEEREIMPKVTINEAAKLLGVSADTLRRWEEEGKIDSERTKGGHRRYDVASLLEREEKQGSTICYARVSTRPQKADLERQAAVLGAYCERMGWEYEVIKDLGSGLNYNNKGLLKLLNLITAGSVKRLVITHKDRLMRFGSELVFSLCETFGTEVIMINKSTETTPEEDLAQDVLEIITVFSARLYGMRSHQNKVLMDELEKTTRRIKESLDTDKETSVY